MAVWESILWLVVIAGAVSCAVYYGVVVCRMMAVSRWLPGLDAGLAHGPSGGWPAVCVVVPAHNEADVIEHIARSLAAQDYANLRVVFALDRCTDATPALVRRVVGGDGRFEVLENDACPPGWAGKVHVVHKAVRGSRAAAGAAYLLFADADTVFAPGCVRAAVGLACARGLDLVSVLPRLMCETWYERIVQPAAGFELVRQYPLDKVNTRDGVGGRPFANGQFMLFRREAYEALGGHESVKDELLEDLAFARAVRKAGRAFGVFEAGGLLRCRMYRSWPAFRKGWKRIFQESARRRPDRLAKWSWRLRATGAVMPLAALCAVVSGAVIVGRDAPMGWALVATGAVGVAMFAVVVVRLQSKQEGSVWWAVAHPLGAWVAGGVMSEAGRELRGGVRTSWGGMDYARGVRRKPLSRREKRARERAKAGV